MAMGGATSDSLAVDQIDSIVEKVGESSLSQLKDLCRQNHWLTGDMLQNIPTMKSLFIELDRVGFLKTYNLKLLFEALGRSDINLDMIYKIFPDAGQDRGQDNSYQPRPISEMPVDSGIDSLPYSSDESGAPAENMETESLDIPVNFEFLSRYVKSAIESSTDKFTRELQSLRDRMTQYESEKKQLLEELRNQKGKSQEQINRLLIELHKLREENNDLQRKREKEKANDESIKNELQQKIEELQHEVAILKKQKDGSEEQKMVIAELQEELKAERRKNALLVEHVKKVEEEKKKLKKDKDEAETKASQLSEKMDKLDMENTILVEELDSAQCQILTIEKSEEVAVANLKRIQNKNKTITSDEQEEVRCQEDDSGNST